MGESFAQIYYESRLAFRLPGLGGGRSAPLRVWKGPWDSAPGPGGSWDDFSRFGEAVGLGSSLGCYWEKSGLVSPGWLT